MTDAPAATSRVGRSYCPACEPTADPMREILDIRWCDTHTPARDGLDDGKVHFEVAAVLSIEAGGEDNRRWCGLIHRERG